MRSFPLPPPPNSTTCAIVLRRFAKTLVMRSFVAVITSTWLAGRGEATRLSENLSSVVLTSSERRPPTPPPGRNVTPRHHVSFTGSRKGGVWIEAVHSRSEASCASMLSASPDTVSTAVARSSDGTAASTTRRAAASTR